MRGRLSLDGAPTVRTDAAALGGPIAVEDTRPPSQVARGALDRYEVVAPQAGRPGRYAYLEAELRVRSGVGTGYSIEAGLGAGDRRTGLRYSGLPDGEARVEVRFEYDFGVSRVRSDPGAREAEALDALRARLEAIDERGQVDLQSAEDAVSAVTAQAIALDNARPGPVREAQWAQLLAVADGSEVLRAVAASPALTAALGFRTPAELVGALRDRAGGDNAPR